MPVIELKNSLKFSSLFQFVGYLKVFHFFNQIEPSCNRMSGGNFYFFCDSYSFTPPTVPVIELSDEQKEQILNSGEFSKFFDKATRMMERALCETVDITFDYSGAETEDTEG